MNVFNFTFQDLEGKHKIKNFYGTRIKLLAYNNSFFSSVIQNNLPKKLSKLYLKTLMFIIIYQIK